MSKLCQRLSKIHVGLLCVFLLCKAFIWCIFHLLFAKLMLMWTSTAFILLELVGSVITRAVYRENKFLESVGSLIIWNKCSRHLITQKFSGHENVVASFLGHLLWQMVGSGGTDTMQVLCHREHSGITTHKHDLHLTIYRSFYELTQCLTGTCALMYTLYVHVLLHVCCWWGISCGFSLATSKASSCVDILTSI